ncbi:hypothetical protein GcM1_230060 [Golovinomyces cichoracearum]|uniref:Karyogamy protein n=1 Tax=Golovinomyces cichoracearum TaxID=62708 RepID=A0A420IN81_9PEZI|nr:hypothetical protein GcM1_230060 [Golovinomyces cichoracearum]
MSFLDLSPSPEPLELEDDLLKILKSEDDRVDMPNEFESNGKMNNPKIPIRIPTHPIACMQGAFTESFLESNSSFGVSTNNEPKSAFERRQQLLEQDVNEETYAARWKLKPGQKHHELWKLTAQISFGIYLLLNGIARDEEQVMKILQVHVDEVDCFLEKTLEDFSLAQNDIEDLLNYLKSHLQNIPVFDVMMENREYRLQIVEENEKIEHIITRTASAMNDALRDVHQGANACKYFTLYLQRDQNNSKWKGKLDMQKVYEAMKGNVDGWYKAFLALQSRGNQLDVALVQLGSIVAELNSRAGEVSRNTRFSSSSSLFSSSFSGNQSQKPKSQASRKILLSSAPGSESKNLTHKLSLRNTLTASKLGLNFEAIPELDSTIMEEEEATPEAELLKPHTYTPLPSPKISSLKTTSNPKYSKRAELMASVSQTNKGFISGNRSTISRRESSQEKEPSHDQTNRTSKQPLGSQLSISIMESQTPPNNVKTPPSRGLDSAYCSDFEKTSPHLPRSTPIAQQESKLDVNRNSDEQNASISLSNSAHSYKLNSLQPPARKDITHRQPGTQSLFTPMSIKIPEKQYFRPVNASPNSPLQRPWTASPLQNPLHAHPNSSGSNLSNYSNYSKHDGGTNSKIREIRSSSRHVNSAMGKMTDCHSEHKQPKKKRSMFGWLKEQFSLTEEEKMRFEEKIRNGNVDRQSKERTKRDTRLEGRRCCDGNKTERHAGGSRVKIK